MTHAHGASDKQGHDMELSLFIIYRIDGTRMKKKKDPATLEAFFSLSLVLLLFLLCNPRFPFAYKRGSRAPHERGDQNIGARHEHTAERQVSSQHPFTPTRDLGSSSSLACL